MLSESWSKTQIANWSALELDESGWKTNLWPLLIKFNTFAENELSSARVNSNWLPSEFKSELLYPLLSLVVLRYNKKLKKIIRKVKNDTSKQTKRY